MIITVLRFLIVFRNELAKIPSNCYCFGWLVIKHRINKFKISGAENRAEEAEFVFWTLT